MEAKIRTTCPRDCYDACGIVVTQSNGRMRVAGDPAHHVSNGYLCGKCTVAYNGVWQDPAARLLTPLRRKGKKGSGSFEAISWETALATVAERLQWIVNEHGAQSILQTHYTGTCSLIAGNMPSRFFNRLGAVEVDPDTVCNKAGHAALALIFGDSLDGFDPRTVEASECVMVWGANPSTSAPHVDRHWLRSSNVPAIVVDPVRHETAAKADLHLQLFPGTDGALAFALLHEIDRLGRIDRGFLARSAVGWDAVEAQLATCDAESGERVTGVPAPAIRRAAAMYSRGPSLLWFGQGFQRQSFGGNAMRAAALLPVATGNIGKPGAGFLYMNGFGTRGIDPAYVTAPHLSAASPASISHMDLPERLASSKTRGLFTWNNNIAASSPRQRRLREALAREDLFHVAIDVFPTDTVDYADVVLPAASFLEFDDIVCSYFHHTVSAQVKAAEPPGVALPNQEIFRRLSAAMGYTEPELFESDERIIAKLLADTGTGETFATLAAKGTVAISTQPRVQFETLTFPTPSGKIEIASQRFVDEGLPFAPSPHAEERPQGQRLRMLSPAHRWLMNSSYDNDARVRKEVGEQAAFLHPADARERGINDGATVRLRNETGELTLVAGLSDDIPRGVVLAPKGRWPKLEPGGGNVNVLNPGQKSDLAESCAVHSIEVEVSPL